MARPTSANRKLDRKRIRVWMAENGIETWGHLADACGLSPQFLSKELNSDFAAPSVIVALQARTGLSLDDIAPAEQPAQEPPSDPTTAAAPVAENEEAT